MSGASAVESVAWNNPIDTGKLPENGASFDTIVVGGGPGGASAAGYLAMGGQRVLLIEKDIWPRDKICGDAVGGKSLSHVQRLGVKEHLEQTPHFRVTGILFSSPKGHEVRVALPEEDVARLEAGYALPREQFDTLLFREVQSTVRKAGGAVIQGGDVRQVLYDDGNGGEDPGPKSGDARYGSGVVVRIGGRGGEELTFHASNLVGAAGYRCPVAKSMLEETYGTNAGPRPLLRWLS